MAPRTAPPLAGRLLLQARRSLWHRRRSYASRYAGPAQPGAVDAVEPPVDPRAALASAYAGQLLRPAWLPKTVPDRTPEGPRRLLLVHVPKTGGSSLRVMLERHVPPEQTFLSTGAHEWVSRSVADLQSVRLFTGHQFLEPLYQFPQDDWVTALVVRDPLAWWRSWYKYWRRRDNQAPGPNTMPETFGEFVEEMDDADLSNPQASWLMARMRVMFDNPHARPDRMTDTGMHLHGETGPTMELLDRLLDRVTALGTTENLVDVYRTVCRAMDWEPVFDVAAHENRARMAEEFLTLTPAQEGRLFDLNRIDTWMVERAATRQVPSTADVSPM